MLLVFATLGAGRVVGAEFPARPPADVTAAQDRYQMMAQLGISFPALPPVADDPNRPTQARLADPNKPDGNLTDDAGNVIVRSGFGLWATYDDAQAVDYTPIDLLRMNDGTPVTTPEQWWTKRRPELLEALQRDLYGRIPAPRHWPAVTWHVRTGVRGGVGAPYIEQNLKGVIDTSFYPEVRDAPKLVATLRLAAGVEGPVPVIVMLGMRGFADVW